MHHLIADEQKQVVWVLAWTSRMARRYGGTVYDKSGKRWDWGQALCRECYGEDWVKELARLNIQIPSWEDIGRAQRWEDGDIPDWVAKPSA